MNDLEKLFVDPDNINNEQLHSFMRIPFPAGLPLRITWKEAYKILVFSGTTKKSYAAKLAFYEMITKSNKEPDYHLTRVSCYPKNDVEWESKLDYSPAFASKDNGTTQEMVKSEYILPTPYWSVGGGTDPHTTW
jgi:hypothetical protein